MIYALLSKLISLVLGTLYPAYFSYKAVRARNVKEYVKWMIYWIVFALFTSIETFTDFFLSPWFPFYYEIKIVLLIWLLSPITEGFSLLYRKFIHPALVHREKEIDELIRATQEQSYALSLELGQNAVKFLTGWIRDFTLKAPGMIARIMNGSTKIVLDQSEEAVKTKRQQYVSNVKKFRSKSKPKMTDIELSDDDMENESSTPAVKEISFTEHGCEGAHSTVPLTKKRNSPERKPKTTNAELSGDEMEDKIETTDQEEINLTEMDSEEADRTVTVTKKRKKKTEDLYFSSEPDSDEANNPEFKNHKMKRKSSNKQNKLTNTC